VPVLIPLSATYNATEPCVVQFASGVNKWIWDVRQGGSIVTAETLEYGEFTEQFAELAALWSTYRLDSVTIEFVPS
jgi:glutathione peroxidase-family protein